MKVTNGLPTRVQRTVDSRVLTRPAFFRCDSQWFSLLDLRSHLPTPPPQPKVSRTGAGGRRGGEP